MDVAQGPVITNNPPQGGLFVNGPYARLTFTAFNPFGESSVSNDTASPSWSSSNVTPTSALLWKKRSFSIPCAEMNPKPRSVFFLMIPCMVFLLASKIQLIFAMKIRLLFFWQRLFCEGKDSRYTHFCQRRGFIKKGAWTTRQKRGLALIFQIVYNAH